MLVQRDPALVQQIRATLRALSLLQGPRSALSTVQLDAHAGGLDQVDLMHVFCACGASARMIAAARARKIPVVVSPLLLTGRDNTAAGPALVHASKILALGGQERAAILQDFLIDSARVALFPPGVGPSLFDATGALFRSRTGIRGSYVLVAGSAAHLQQQDALACALAQRGIGLLFLLAAQDDDAVCLRRMSSLPGVCCLGDLQHDPAMWLSALAAASAVVLPGSDDRCARSVLHALAVGTPVVTGHAAAAGLGIEARALRRVGMHDPHAWRGAVLALADAQPSRALVQALARPFSWEHAARRLAACYAALLPAGRLQPAKPVRHAQAEGALSAA
jgi:glycosyltransferase involved in cell wall biosynthesis